MVKDFSEEVGNKPQIESGDVVTNMSDCLYCGADLSTSELFQHYRLCPNCRYHYAQPAWERIATLADEGTFIEINRAVTSLDPISFSGEASYKKRVFDAQKRTGLPEAVVTGVCQIEGALTVLIVLDFAFLGGSMGCVVGEKVALAFEHALKKKLPVVAVVSSGGVRVQEGVLALMQMAKTVAVAQRLHDG